MTNTWVSWTGQIHRQSYFGPSEYITKNVEMFWVVMTAHNKVGVPCVSGIAKAMEEALFLHVQMPPHFSRCYIVFKLQLPHNTKALWLKPKLCINPPSPDIVCFCNLWWNIDAVSDEVVSGEWWRNIQEWPTVANSVEALVHIHEKRTVHKKVWKWKKGLEKGAETTVRKRQFCEGAKTWKISAILQWTSELRDKELPEACSVSGAVKEVKKMTRRKQFSTLELPFEWIRRAIPSP